MPDLLKRVLTALALAPIALALTWLGGWGFALLVAFAVVVSQFELYSLMRQADIRPMVPLGLVLGLLAALHPRLPWALPVLVAGGIVLLMVFVFRRTEQPLSDISGTLLGVFYPAFLLSFAITLREADGFPLMEGDGFWLMVTVLVGVWGADTIAYFTGRAFGKTKLLPAVSPKKTWEGAIGGLFGAFAIIAVFKVFALSQALGWIDVVALGVCCGVAGPLGDLLVSRFKRSVGAKDTGNWLPGHGGLLDRLDAAILAVPLATLYLDHVAKLF
jgi:phosphatidate cytidylyltransferase